jgi:hypothetical protein
MRTLLLAALTSGLVASAGAADDRLGAAMKLYEKHRYEQAARVLEGAAGAGAQGDLMLGMIYLRNARLHEAFARTAAAVGLDYLDKLLKASGEERSRYARLYLAEALVAAGRAHEAAPHFQRFRAETGIDPQHRALASVGLGSAPAQAGLEVRLARAAAQRKPDSAKLAAEAQGEKNLSPRARRYLIEVYLDAGMPEQALAVARSTELGAASHVETFKAAKGTAKNIAFYDLALVGDLARLYRELARRRLEQAAADPRLRPTAEYYLAEALAALGEHAAAAEMARAFAARSQAPAPYRTRAQARLGSISFQQGKKDDAERAWNALAESGDLDALAAAVTACAEAQAPCAKVLARAAQAAEAGDVRRTRALNIALGAYHLRMNDPARALAYMEAGRDKSNKNKIEANDPEMLTGLAEAYYRTKKFSEGLEIFFEMSQEFAVVRQIQEALQGVYSMEQRSAGDVRIL